MSLVALGRAWLAADDSARALATLLGSGVQNLLVVLSQRAATAPDGFLVVGHAENVRRLVRGFRMHGHSILEKQR